MRRTILYGVVMLMKSAPVSSSLSSTSFSTRTLSKEYLFSGKNVANLYIILIGARVEKSAY